MVKDGRIPMSEAGRRRNRAEDKVKAGKSKRYRISTCRARLRGASSPEWDVEVGENNVCPAH